MTPKLSVPTDNIYKFYALFGILLFISAVFSTLWAYTSTIDSTYELLKEYEELTDENKEKSTRVKFIEKRFEAIASDKEFYLKFNGGLFGVATVLIIIGFGTWQYKIQPKQDEYFELQIKRLKLEITSQQKNRLRR